MKKIMDFLHNLVQYRHAAEGRHQARGETAFIKVLRTARPRPSAGWCASILRNSSILTFMLVFFAATQARADAVTYTYDPLHTQILFGVNHMGFTTSHGRFNKFTGKFTLDEAHPELTTAEISIDVNSLDMASAVWNEHVQDKFLEPTKFPAITFKSTSVKRTGDKTATMTGDLTLHGVTKPVTLNVTLNKIGQNPMMQSQQDAGFSLTGTIKRSDFGISAFIPLVSDDVTLDIQVDGVHPNEVKLNK